MSHNPNIPVHVAVFGGGISGLTAAHELADRGLKVTVYESRKQLGGLARSSYATAPEPKHSAQRTLNQPENCTVCTAVGGPEGSLLVAGSIGIGVWYTPTGEFLRVLGGEPPLLPGEVRSLAMDRGAKRVVYCHWDSDEVHVADVRNPGLAWDLPGHAEAVTQVASSPNGRWVVTGDEVGELLLWRRTTTGYNLVEKGTPSAAQASPVLSLAMTNNGVMTAVLENARASRGVISASITYTNNIALTATAVASGGVVAASASGEVELTVSGSTTHYLNGSAAGVVNKVAASSNGNFLASGSDGGTLNIWRTGQPADPRWTLEMGYPIHALTLRGKFAYVASRRMGSYPHKIWQVDMKTGEIVREFAPPGTSAIAGEHGFRFFPSFYRHVTDTMSRIPDPEDHRRSVADNLTSTDRQGVALNDRFRTHVFHRSFDLSIARVFEFLQGFLTSLGYDMRDIALFSLKTFQFLTSGPRRRREYEKMTWWQFVEGDRYSPHFQRYLDQLPKVLVALDARQADARTQGIIFLQLLQDQVSRGEVTDRTLNGPSSEAWFDKWQRWLERLGVEFVFDAELKHFALNQAQGLDDDHIDHAVVNIAGTDSAVFSNFMVMAIPARVGRRVVEATKTHNPWWVPCGDMYRLWKFPVARSFGPISGIQFFLRHEVKIVRGHVVYPDSEWGLSSISQDQFWDPERRLRMRRDFDVRGQISAIIGAWDTPVTVPSSPRGPAWMPDPNVVGKTAAQITDPAMLAREVWRQLLVALDGRMAHPIREITPRGDMPEPLYYHLESFPQEPDQGYLLNLVGDWDGRPGELADNGWRYDYEVALGRLVNAGNHMKTHTRLSTMESANESGRHAVNSILRHVGFREDGATVWPLEDWEVLEAQDFKRLDDILYEAGQPHFVDILRLFELTKNQFPCRPDANVNKTEMPGAEPGPLRSLLECTGVSAAELAKGLCVSVDDLVAADRYLRENADLVNPEPPAFVPEDPGEGFGYWPYERAPSSGFQESLTEKFAAFLRAARDLQDQQSSRISGQAIWHALDLDRNLEVDGEERVELIQFVREQMTRDDSTEEEILTELRRNLGAGPDTFADWLSGLDDKFDEEGIEEEVRDILLAWIAEHNPDARMDQEDRDEHLDLPLPDPDARLAFIPPLDPEAAYRRRRIRSGRARRDTVRPNDAVDHGASSAPVVANEARSVSSTLLAQILSPSPFSFLFRR